MNDLVAKYCGTFLQNRASLLSVLDGTIWNYTMQVLDYTRSYEDGILFLSKLSAEVEKAKDSFSKKDYERHLNLIYYKYFDFLDKLDRWEEYLETWDQVLKNVKIGYDRPKKNIPTAGVYFNETHRKFVEGFLKDMPKYIIGEDDKNIHLHFLMGLRHRRKIIERKLEKKKAGKFFGKLHEQQSELTQRKSKKDLIG